MKYKGPFVRNSISELCVLSYSRGHRMLNSHLHVCWQCVYTTTLLWKNIPSGFWKIHINNIHFFKSSRSQILGCVTSQAPPTIIDWHVRLTLDLPWVSCHQFAIVSALEQLVIYSQHLLHWRCSGVRLLLKGMRPPICLRLHFFCEFCKSPFWIITS